MIGNRTMINVPRYFVVVSKPVDPLVHSALIEGDAREAGVGGPFYQRTRVL